MSNRGVAFSVARCMGQVIITVPCAYRMWSECTPGQQVDIRWGEAGLVLADLPGQPVVTLTVQQRERLLRYQEGQTRLSLLMQDPHGRYRIVGQLQGKEAADD